MCSCELENCRRSAAGAVARGREEGAAPKGALLCGVNHQVFHSNILRRSGKQRGGAGGSATGPKVMRACARLAQRRRRRAASQAGNPAVATLTCRLPQLCTRAKAPWISLPLPLLLPALLRRFTWARLRSASHVCACSNEGVSCSSKGVAARVRGRSARFVSHVVPVLVQAAETRPNCSASV